ncbi:MAG: hypothetical protein QNL70_12935 [Pseudomonas sp.]
MELICLECDGIGWLAVPGQDLIQQLGWALTRSNQRARLLQAHLPECDGAQGQYRDESRDGMRGHYTGD